MISSTAKCLRNDLVVFLYTIDASLRYEMGDIWHFETEFSEIS